MEKILPAVPGSLGRYMQYINAVIQYFYHSITLSPAVHHVLTFCLCSHGRLGALCMKHNDAFGDELTCFTQEPPSDDL